MSKKRWLVIVVVVVAAVIIAVVLDTMLVNHQPVIASLEAEPEGIIPQGSCQIVCDAKDRDGDELSYNWSADGGAITGEGDTVTWKAPSSVGSYNVTVIVADGRGGENMKQITIVVRFNTAPQINSLIADAEWTTPLGSVQVTCTTSDPDGDELSYEWTTDGGDISGTGPAVNWIAPQDFGVCNITVVVTDGYGGLDMRTLPISVASEQPPVIEDLLITADHCYLKTNTSPYKVGKKQEYYIECVVADTSIELSYEWSCEDGTISGEGSMITWTAPDEYLARTTVTVTVSNIAGNMVSKSLVLNVVSCSACTFRC